MTFRHVPSQNVSPDIVSDEENKIEINKKCNLIGCEERREAEQYKMALRASDVMTRAFVKRSRCFRLFTLAAAGERLVRPERIGQVRDPNWIDGRLMFQPVTE